MDNKESRLGKKGTEPQGPVGFNTPVIGILEGQSKKGGAEKVLEEIITKNFLNAMKNIKIQSQEIQQSAHRINSKSFTASFESQQSLCP